ncbi:MAG: hypothetical protein K8S13_16775 [Desulfobacula sp.]|uniref:hypothetical protein n=1 Tax=Desulfobacula sp. TaxID=2593537 RepID=UPI0025BA9F2F|nr:hypothetical protein [Desulfobacula sp.]MCD4721495.1 hypothetical protein [Desulfobacula sp.]
MHEKSVLMLNGSAAIRKSGFVSRVPVKRSVPMQMLIVSLAAFEKTSNDAEARYEILQKAENRIYIRTIKWDWIAFFIKDRLPFSYFPF